MSAAVIALSMAVLPEVIVDESPGTLKDSKEAQCGVTNTSFKDGEEVIYMVYYNVHANLRV